MRKISIVINKSWEVEPALNAITNYKIRPKGLVFPTSLNSPKDGNNRMNTPRATYQLNGNTPLEITIWCLEDLMDPAKNSSSSEEKFRVLPSFLNQDMPDLVFAVGTACYPDEKHSKNGKVIIGSQFFMHNGHLNNPDSNFNTPEFDKLIVSNVKEAFFNLFTEDWLYNSIDNFLPVPNKPSDPAILADRNFVSVGTLNVTKYDEYPTADPASLDAFKNLNTAFKVTSLETTHGIIRLSSNAPTIFISGIVNRITKLSDEGTPAQNYVGAFNTGVAISNLLLTISASNSTEIW